MARGAGATATVAQSASGASRWTTVIRALRSDGFLPYTWTAGRTPSARFPWPVPAALQLSADRAGALTPRNPFVVAALRAVRASCGTLLQHPISSCLLAGAAPMPRRWRWILVSQRTPEVLRLWVAPGRGGDTGWVFSSPVNTGVFHSTPDGTYSIRVRFAHARMRGSFPVPVVAGRVLAYDAAVRTDTVQPDLSWLPRACGVPPGTPVALQYRGGQAVCLKPYDDPAVPWVNYFHGGIALHGYPRRHYGFPQSNGCVEMPVDRAARLFPMVFVGVPITLVAGRSTANR